LNILDFSQLDYGSGITLDLNSGGDEDLIATDGVDKSLELDLSYQPQINFVVGTAYDDTIIGNSLGDILEGGDGNDLLASGAGNDDLEGGAGDDTYVFDAAHAIDDSLGSDVITENIDAGNDTLDFSSFSDAYGGVTINLADTDEQTVHDSSLDLTLADGNSIENVIGNDAGLYATGNDLDNSLIGGAEDDVLAGGAGNDVLEGRGGDDSLTGGDGNDTYVFNPTGGNLGTDTITEDANAGSDTLDFSALTDDVTVDISSTTNPQTIHSSELSLYLTDATGIENVIGSSTAANTITGNSRDNYLLGGAVVDTIDGGSGNDTLEGAAGNDSLTGGTGDDTYVFDPLLGDDGDLGSDTIYEAANAGSDTLDFSNFAEDQPVTIDLGNTSAQTVSSGVLTLTLATYNTGIENVLSGAGDDSITGNSRANILDGGDGDDILIGNDGDDRLYGESGEDQLQGNAGSDALYGGDDADILYGGTGDDFLYGQDGNDTLTDYDHFGSTTEGGADYFDGGNGNDSLYTYSGNDTLIGGAGDDVLVGGTGADTFSFVWHQGDYGLGSDTITQDTSDTLDFSHFYSVDYAAPDSTASGDQPVSDDQVSDALDSESEPDVRDLLTVNFSNTDAVGGVISPDAFTSSVAGVTVASDDSGTLEISAYGLQGTYDSVDFYLDSNRNGVLDTNDQFLGTANDLTESASFDLPYDLDLGVFTAQDGHSTTVNSAPGPAALFAVPMEGGAPGSPSSPTALAQGLIPKAPPPTATRALLLKRGIFGGAFASVNAQAYGGQPLYEYDTPAPQFDHEEDGTAEMSDPNGYISWSNGIVNSTASSKMDIRGSFTVNATNSAKTSGAAALWGTGDAWATPTAKANTNSPPGPDKWIIDPVYPIGNPDGYYRGSVFVAKIVGTITVSWANFATAVGTSASAGSATIAGVDISARSPIIGEQPWGTGQDYSLNLITKTTTTSTGPIGTLVYTHGSTTLINTTKLNPNFGSLTKTFTLTVGTSHAFPAVVSLTSSLIQSSTANTGGAFYSAVYAFGQSTVQVTFRVVSMTYDSSLLISDGD
jgi:Ca2+-binding RTX toxin-like protein